MAVERGAHVVRTHDVAETRDAALVGAEFARDRVRASGDVSVEELDVTTPDEARRHLVRVGGPGDDAAQEAVARTFEFGGLSDAERTALAAAAAGAGATLVVGSDGARALLVGTAGALSATLADARGESAALDDALGAAAGALEGSRRVDGDPVRPHDPE
jgi:dihydropteroate synthase